MTIQIFGLPYSTYVRTVIMTCLEKNAPFELRSDGLDPPSGLRRRPHLERHPFGRMPAIRHGDFQLFETSAICRYLDEAFGDTSLLPANPQDRARMEQWISAINDYLDPCIIRRFVVQYAFPTGEGGAPDRATIEAAIPEIRRGLRILEGHYGEDGYLVGGRLSLADLFLAPMLHYLERSGEGGELLAQAPKVARGLETGAARPSFQQVVK